MIHRIVSSWVHLKGIDTRRRKMEVNQYDVRIYWIRTSRDAPALRYAHGLPVTVNKTRRRAGDYFPLEEVSMPLASKYAQHTGEFEQNTVLRLIRARRYAKNAAMAHYGGAHRELISWPFAKYVEKRQT